MTSEAYVWAHLPGDTQPTICGLFQHTKTPAGLAAGSFVYAKSYLANPDAAAIDPIALPLKPIEFSTTSQGGVFGALHDAMPDDWGRYVIDRTQGEQPYPVGYMLNTTGDSIGHLSFSASRAQAPSPEDAIEIDLVEQARAVLLNIEGDMEIPSELVGKVRANTAMGGARPKLTVEHQGSLWLAKFPSRKDDPHLPQAKLEAAMLHLATLCGVSAAEGLVVHDDVLLVKRFDRRRMNAATKGWARDSFLSARTLFHSDIAAPTYLYSPSYARLAKELTRYSTQGSEDQEQLFRRMVFNALISNTDDHDRNHGLIADDVPGTYRLSPAYDLVPQIHRTLRRYHAMTLGQGESLATRQNLLADCESFGLKWDYAEWIFEAISADINEHWRDCLHTHGLSANAISRLETCFSGVPARGPEQAVTTRPARKTQGSPQGVRDSPSP